MHTYMPYKQHTTTECGSTVYCSADGHIAAAAVTIDIVFYTYIKYIKIVVVSWFLGARATTLRVLFTQSPIEEITLRTYTN